MGFGSVACPLPWQAVTSASPVNMTDRRVSRDTENLRRSFGTDVSTPTITPARPSQFTARPSAFHFAPRHQSFAAPCDTQSRIRATS